MTRLDTTLRKIYAYRALDDFVLMYPFYGVYMAAKGMSIFQISTLFILWSITSLVTNIPSGVLADKFSRKKLLATGQLLKAASFVPWFVYPHYAGFALGFVLWGVGGALTDGTFEALVYDELRASERQSEYVKVTGKAFSFSLVGNLAATLIAGAAIVLGFGFIFAASITAIVASSFVVLALPETLRFEQVADARYFSMLRAGVHEALHNHTVLAIIGLASFIGVIYDSLEEYVPLFVKDTGVSLSLVAWAVGATVAAAALGSYIAFRYEKLSTVRFMLLLALSGLFLLSAGATGKVYSVILLIGYTFFIRMLKQVYDGKLQHSIGSELRATVTSVGGFVVELLALITYVLYGLIAGRTSNFKAFAVLGGIVMFVSLLYLVAAPRLLARQSLKQLAGETN